MYIVSVIHMWEWPTYVLSSPVSVLVMYICVIIEKKKKKKKKKKSFYGFDEKGTFVHFHAYPSV